MRVHNGLIGLAAVALLATQPAAGAGTWTRIGPEGGAVCTLVSAPSRPAKIYAGLATGGVYRSGDGGVTWTFAGAGLGADNPACALAVEPEQPRSVWAATPEGLFKSENGGATWTFRGPNIVEVRRDVVAVAIHPLEPSTVVTAFGIGPIYVTHDGGDTWADAGPEAPLGAVNLTFDPRRPSTLYAGAEGLFRSLDGGTNWSRLKGLPKTLVDAFVIDPLDSRRLYAVTAGVLYRSADGGERWFRSHEDARTVSVVSELSGGLSAVYLGTTAGVLRSGNGGRTWNPTGPGISPPAVRAVVATPVSVVAATEGGAFFSFDRGSSWSAGDGLRATILSSLAVIGLATGQAPALLFASSDRGVFRSADGGETWTGPSPFTPVEGILAAASPRRLYLATAEAFFRTFSSGTRWSRLPWPGCLPDPRVAVEPGAETTLYVSGATAACADACGLFRSTDAGSSWICAEAPAPTPVLLGIDPFAPSHVYAAGEDLYHSTDRGGTWELLAADISPLRLAFSPAQPGLVFAALGEGGAARSADGGATWEIRSEGLPDDEWLEHVAVDPALPDTVYAATATRVFHSADGGLTWQLLTDGLGGELLLTDLKVDPVDPAVLYLATKGGGVMRLRRE
jgi:photosystem II stability/assembly factor-like uncharacterized protein